MIKTMIMETPATYAYLNSKDTIDHKLVATSEESQPARISSFRDIITKQQSMNDHQPVPSAEASQSADLAVSSSVSNSIASIPQVRVFQSFYRGSIVDCCLKLEWFYWCLSKFSRGNYLFVFYYQVICL